MKRAFFCLLSGGVSTWTVIECLSHDCILWLLVLGVVILFVSIVLLIYGTLKTKWISSLQYLLTVAIIAFILVCVSSYGVYVNWRYTDSSNIADTDLFIPKPDSVLVYQSTVENDLFAQKKLSEIFYNGVGVNRDFTQSIKYMQLADAQEDAYAAIHLGMMYYKGFGQRINYLMAYSYFKKALLRGNIAFEHVYYLYYMLQKKLVPDDPVIYAKVSKILDNYRFLNQQVMIKTCDFDIITKNLARITRLADEGYLSAIERLSEYYSYIGNRAMDDKYVDRAISMGSTSKYVIFSHILKQRRSFSINTTPVDTILQIPFTSIWRNWYDDFEEISRDIFDRYRIAMAIVADPQTDDQGIIRKDEQRLFMIKNKINKEIASKCCCLENPRQVTNQ